MDPLELVYNFSKSFTKEELVELFKSNNWESYKEPDKLFYGLKQSTQIITCRTIDHKLVGIVRSMDDRNWCANIDCLIVHKDYQGNGIGSQLMKYLLNDLEFHKIKYINISPDSKEMERFYSNFGFQKMDGIYMQLKMKY